MVQEFKDYLYEKWKERGEELRLESREIEGKFREKGCPVCGKAKVKNGGWTLHGGRVLVCPHMERYVTNRLRKKMKEQKDLLVFINKGCPMHMLIQEPVLALTRTYQEEYLLQCQKIQMWEDEYVEKHTKGKTDKQLESEGWWRTNFGDWTCMKLGEAKHRKFKKDFERLLRLKIGQVSAETGIPCKWSLQG